MKTVTLLHYLMQFRKCEPVRVVAALYRLPPPPDPAWEVVDFAVTPWKGRSIEALAKTKGIRYLPLGYNARIHTRKTDLPSLGPVFVGNTLAEREAEADSYLKALREENTVLCIGSGFEQKYLDPFMLGRMYAAARCVPNFHYGAEGEQDWILNERFWQSASCGIPVNDWSPLMEEVWDKPLLETLCFRDRQCWQDRVRRLNAGTETVLPRSSQNWTGR